MQQHNIAYLGKVVTLRCDAYRGHTPSYDDIRTMVYEIQGGADPFFHGGLDDATIAGRLQTEMPRFMARTAWAQWPFQQVQQQGSDPIIRAATMFDRIPSEMSDKLKVNWAQQLQAIAGFAPHDLITMLLMIFVNYQHDYGDILTHGNLVRTFENTAYNAEQIDRFLSAFSSDQEGIIQLVARRQEGLPLEYEYYSPRPFQEFPLVRVGRWEYVIPSMPMFVHTLTWGLFWKVRNALLGSATGQTDADDDLGLLLEIYARELMEHYLPSNEFVGEITYSRGKWADAAIVRGTEGIILEAKAHGFGLAAAATGDLAGAEKDLALNLIKGLEQIAKNLREQAEAACADERIGPVRQWFPLILLYEAPFLLNLEELRKSVLSKLSCADAEMVADYQVLTIGELEALMKYYNTIHPVDVIKRKLAEEPSGTIWNSLLGELGDARGSANTSYFDKGLEDIWQKLAGKIPER